MTFIHPSGDRTGKADSATIQNAFNAQLPDVELSPGQFFFASSVTPQVPCRFHGSGAGTVLQAINCNLVDFQYIYLNGQPAGGFEMDHLTLTAAGGHVFAHANFKQAVFRNLTVIQNDANHAIWYQPQNMLVDVTFRDIISTVYGSTRSIPAWFIENSTNGNLADVTFERVTFTNADYDNTQYQLHAACTGPASHGSGVVLRGCYFESCYGGCAQILSVTGPIIDDCSVWDVYPGFSKASVGNSLFYIGQAPGASPCVGASISRVRRSRGGPDGVRTWDVWLDPSTCSTMISGYTAWGPALTSTPIYFNLNASSEVTLLGNGSQVSHSPLVITNPSSVPYTPAAESA